MSTKSLIFSTNLKGYQPVVWYGETIYARYSQIHSILRNRLGEEFANILSEPLIPHLKDTEFVEGKWFSNYIKSGTPLNRITEPQKTILLKELDSKLNQIKALSDELKNATDIESKMLGEIVTLSIEIPNSDCILVENDRIVFALWGFTSDETKKSNFKLSKYIEKVIEPDRSKTESKPDSIAEIPVENPPVGTEEVVDKSTEKIKETSTKKWWILALIGLLLIIGVYYLFFYKENAGDYLPSKPGIIAPVDSTKIIQNPDDPLHREIISNRLNILLNKSASLNEFVEKFKNEYGSSVSIVAFDPTYKLLQIEFDPAERKQWRDNLYKFQEVSVVFDEQIFVTNSQPNDPDFSDNKKKWFFEAVNAFSAWDMTMGSPNVTVAIIDGGFDAKHAELSERVSGAWNVISGTPATNFINPIGGMHGTHVAGTSVGSANNAKGTSGIAPNCKLMLLQVADSHDKISSLGVLFAIQYAILNGADVINLSLGAKLPQSVIDQITSSPVAQQQELLKEVQSSTHFQEEQAVYDKIFAEANKNEVVVVKAAGNENIPLEFDAMSVNPFIINVSAVDQNKQKATFSNFGKLSTVSAPGVQIYSSVPNNKYQFLDGTSMASPIVAGAIALIKSKRPDLSATQIKEILIKTGIPINNSDKPIGPLIQIDKALIAAGSTLSCDCSKEVDSLKREIEKLKKNVVPDTTTKLVIPCNPTDIKFAVGRWRASNNLTSLTTNSPIQLYFDIKPDGSGLLTLIEQQSKKEFKAKTKITIDNNQLIINQLEDAKYNDQEFYQSYKFVFVSKCGEEAFCNAQAKADINNKLSFYLYKE